MNKLSKRANRYKGHCLMCGQPIDNGRERHQHLFARVTGKVRRFGTKRQRATQDGW